MNQTSSHSRNMPRILLLFLTLCFTGMAGAEETAPNPPGSTSLSTNAEISEAKPAPVVVWNRTITVLRASPNNTDPAVRARGAASRIEALPARKGIEILTVNASTPDGTTGIILATRSGLLLALYPDDVDPASGETLEDTAKAAADQLKSILDERADELKISNLLHDVGVTAAATLVYILLIWIIVRFKRYIVKKIDKWISGQHRSLSVADIDLVPILIAIERIIIKLFFLAVILSLTYLWLTYCLSGFFFTQPWAARLGEYLVDFFKALALRILGAAPGIFTVFVIFWLTRVISAGVSRFFYGVERKILSVEWLQPDSARASRRIVVVGIWLFALILAYPYIPGSGSAAFKGVSVFAGIIVSLGSTGFVNHIMSGLAIAYSGAISAGDYISVGDIEGTVLELGPMSTKIMTPTRYYTTIPNGVVISGHITNFSRLAGKDGAIVSTVVTIGYDVPWRKVHDLLLSAASRTDSIRRAPVPYVLQRSLSDFYVRYELRFYIDRPAERQIVLSALHTAIQDGFHEADVQIMSPHFVSQPTDPVVAPKSQWYEQSAQPPKNGEGSP